MAIRRELLAFSAVLSAFVAGFLGESLFCGRVLSPADVLFVSASFRERGGPRYEPANRLLMDPVLQFQPWLEFNRACSGKADGPSGTTGRAAGHLTLPTARARSSTPST